MIDRFYFLLITFFCGIINGFSQELRFEELESITPKTANYKEYLEKSEKMYSYSSYRAKDGTIFRAGSKFKLNVPFKGAKYFDDIFYIDDLFRALTLQKRYSGGVTELKKISIGRNPRKKKFSAIFEIKLVTGEFEYKTYINFESALENKEIEILPSGSLELPKPTSPAMLEFVSINFSDNNNVLEANEKATIDVSLTNTGKGAAYNLVALLKFLQPYNNISLPSQQSIGTLNPKDTIRISIPISAGLNLESGSLELELKIQEGNGFNSDPMRVSIRTEKFKNPLVAVVDYKFSKDQGGRIRLGQSIILEVLIQNRGQGKASQVKVNFNNPTNVFPGSKNTFLIDNLAPNESKIVQYEFFANKMFADKDILIDVTIEESYKKFGEKRVLKVSLDQTLQPTKTVTVASQILTPVQIDNVRLMSENDVNAPVKEDIASEVTTNGKPTFYSLFIGVDNYQFSSANLFNLNRPITDASALRTTLLSRYSFSEAKSIFLKNPTRSEILNALEELAKKVTQKDNLLIFYAGHGYWDEKLNVGYWLPSDSKTNDKSSWIANSTMKDYIAGIESKHTLLIADACFSGGIFKTREVTSEINQYGAAKIYSLPSRKAITSGTLTTVPDNSKFMELLLKRLNQNTSDYLTAKQLFYSIETAVLNDTNTVPQFGVIQGTGDEGGDFLFIKK